MNALLPGGIIEVNSSYAPAEDSCTDLTVIIPTRNEAGNVASLVSRLDAALGDLDASILFVDDSSDQGDPISIYADVETSSGALAM